MNLFDFDCERHHIESILEKPQKDLLVQLYCAPKFTFINMVDVYYRIAKENAILMFIFILIIFPVLCMFVAYIADKYLSKGMQDLSKRFKLSPTLAALTLIAFANGAPDLLSSLSAAEKPGGELISLGNMLGGYIFCMCLVVSNVLWNAEAGFIKLPKYAVIKDLSFYLISLGIVTVFGLWGKSTIIFVIVYFSTYAIYMYVSLQAEKWDKQALLDESLDSSLQQTNDEMISEVESIDQYQKNVGFAEIEERDSELDRREEYLKGGLFAEIVDDLIETEASLVENIIIMPLAVAGMFTICYLDNPFMKTPAKYLLIGISLSFLLYMFELTSFTPFILILIGQVTGISFFVFELLDFSKNLLAVIYEFISVFAAIGWISLFADCIVDLVTFLAFYFDINELILASILLSAGNNVSDYFGNAALSKAGEPVMGALACFSGPIFNNYVGYGLAILGGLATNDKFDIFGLNRPAPVVEESMSMNEEVGHYYMTVLVLYTAFVIILLMVYLAKNNYVLRLNFPFLAICAYSGFAIVSVVLALLSRL